MIVNAFVYIKHITYLNSFIFTATYKVATIILILQMRKVRCREVMWFAQNPQIVRGRAGTQMMNVKKLSLAELELFFQEGMNRFKLLGII